MSSQLRSYFYIDEEAVDDFLAQLEGSPTEGAYSEHELSVAGEDVEHSSSTLEVRRTRRDTLQAKMSHLYELLEQDSRIESLDKSDPGIYGSIRVRQVVEISGAARLPKWEGLKRDIASASSWIRVFEAAGQDPLADPTAKAGFEAFSMLAAMGDQQDSAIIIKPLEGQKFQVVARLRKKYLRRETLDFETELTILGKVQRKLTAGQEVDVAGMWPKLQSLQAAQAQNRAARRATKTGTKQSAPADPISAALQEAVLYPAIEIVPIAVFQ